MMGKRCSFWIRLGAITLVLHTWHHAYAIEFDSQNSYAAITHDPGPNALGLIMDPVTTLYTDHPLRKDGFPELASFNITSDLDWNVDPILAPTPIPTYTAFINIPDATLAGAGVSHYTLPGDYNLSDPAYANYSMAYETGVGQDNTALTFTDFSTLTVDLHMQWDATSGWAGPNLSAYQFLGIDLVSMAAGDESKVSAVYDYTLEVQGQAIPDKLHLEFADLATGGEGVKSVFLFDSGYIRNSDLPPTASGVHTLTLDATIIFEAKDPFRPTLSRLFKQTPETRQAIENFLHEQIIIEGGSKLPPEVFDNIFALQGGGVGAYTLINNPPPNPDPTGNLNGGIEVIPEPTTAAVLLIIAAGLLPRRFLR